MVTYINKKNKSQLTSDPGKFKHPEDFEEYKPKKNTYAIGNKQFATKEEYNAAKALLYPEMSSSGKGKQNVTPDVKAFVEEQNPLSQTNIQKNAQNLEEQGAFKETQEPQNLQEAVNINEPGVINVGSNIPTVQALRSQATFEFLDMGSLSDSTLESFRNSPEMMADPTMSALIKTDLDLEVLKSGDAKASQLGALVEGIPIVGTLVRKYAGNLIQTPGGDVDDIMSELTTIDGDIKLQQTYAANGGDPSTIFTNMQAYEDRIAWLESKIKLLTAQSPELRSNPEEVDKIMQQIRGIYSHITSARTAVTQAAINNIQSDSMTDFQLLQRYKNAANATKSDS